MHTVYTEYPSKRQLHKVLDNSTKLDSCKKFKTFQTFEI